MNLKMNTDNVTRRRIFVRAVIIATLLTALSSCAIMSKKDCLQGHWQQAGYHDAISGHAKSRFELRNKACAKHAIASDQTSYLQGYQRGVTTYCQPDHAIEAGTRNHDYRDICPAELQLDFLTHYVQGLKVARNDLRFKYWQRDGDLQHARFRHLTTETEHDKQRIKKRIQALSSSLDNIRTLQLETNRKILRWQAETKRILRESKPEKS